MAQPPRSLLPTGRLLRLLTLAGLAWAGSLGAEMQLDAPVQQFRLPHFGPEGYRDWDLRAESGRLIDADRVEITGLVLRVYSGDASQRLLNTVTSPAALVRPSQSRAEGSGPLQVEGANYRLQGEDWTWEGTNGTVRVRRSARVVFQESLDYLLQ